MPFFVCLSIVVLVAIWMRTPLLTSLSDLWAMKGKIVAANGSFSVECSGGTTDEEYLLKNAMAGHVMAQHELAFNYAHGTDDFSKNYSEAGKWYRVAAENGSVLPQYMMGVMYAPAFHDMVPASNRSKISKSISAELNFKLDFAEAAKWWKLAAQQGSSPAQYSLAYLYRDGAGVKQNYEEAYFWMLLATKYRQKQFEYDLNLFSNLLSPSQIAAVQKRAGEWKDIQIKSQSSPLINVSALMCGRKTMGNCKIVDECQGLLAINCYSDHEGTRHYFAIKQTRELLDATKFGAPPKEWTCGKPKEPFHD